MQCHRKPPRSSAIHVMTRHEVRPSGAAVFAKSSTTRHFAVVRPDVLTR
jgi:hypothetical protein